MTDDNGLSLRQREPRRCYFILDSDNFAVLARAAAQRKIHPNKLATKIFHVITSDKLIDAILDDVIVGNLPVRRRRPIGRVANG